MDNFYREPEATVGIIRFAKHSAVYPRLAKSPLLLGSLTPDGVLQLISESWSLALGCPVQELGGRRLVDFIEPEEVGRADALLQASRGGLKDKRASFALVGQDGRRTCFEWHSRVDDYDGVGIIVGTKKRPDSTLGRRNK
jgi:hypothetical protein